MCETVVSDPHRSLHKLDIYVTKEWRLTNDLDGTPHKGGNRMLRLVGIDYGGLAHN
jgi:hypothetical protein